MSAPANVVVGIEDAVAYVTINRPDKRNAIDSATRAELIAAVDAVAVDPLVRVVVITGAGEKAFASGADLSEGAETSVLELRASLQERRIYDAIAECPKPVVAMIKGYCVGGGCELALSTDIRIASDRATFGQPEIRLGMIPGGGGTQRLARLIGAGQAMRLIVTGDLIDATEAHRLGLVEVVVPHDELEQRTKDLCASIARHSPVALRCAKQAIQAAAELPLHEGLAVERDLFCQSYASQDRIEGIAAFLEKRPPNFTGR